MSFYNQLRKPENKEFNERFTYARQIGVQTLVEKLINIYSATDKVPDPQTIMFLKEKTKFLQWLGEKITDLYGIKSKEFSRISSRIRSLFPNKIGMAIFSSRIC